MKKITTPSAPLRVAIVGGGIAGLSSAYYLMQRARRLGVSLDIQLFEGKLTLGGNADTVVVDLGRYQMAGGGSSRYLRWADLGVNDANLTAYKLMKEVMTDIGYLQNMKPLQDTTCYHDPSSSLALTDDSSLVNSVSDPRFNLADADAGRLFSLIQVVHQTALALLGHIATDYTCGRYFQDCIDDPRAMLSAAAQHLDINIAWDAPDLADLLYQVRDNYYYPRISAMYFTDPRGPAVMPLQAPFEYYRLQEGGATAPQRCYFDKGSQTWLDALAAHLVASSDAKISLKIRTGTMVRVDVSARGTAILYESTSEAVDVCVMANHADDALRALDFDVTAAILAARLKGILGAVRYTYGYAVCHTAAGLMPTNRNVWRTYNIPIRGLGDSRFPYRIDYVVNLHQNDPDNPAYDHAGMPMYFVSLVDDLNRIPRQEMLDRVTDPQAVPAAWRDRLPKALLDPMRGGAVAETGYRHQLEALSPELDTKAWTVFKHNVLDAGCIQAQADILCLNQSWADQRLALTSGKDTAQQPSLLFAGGWTLGAGLQEQCLQQSLTISGLILPD